MAISIPCLLDGLAYAGAQALVSNIKAVVTLGVRSFFSASVAADPAAILSSRDLNAAPLNQIIAASLSDLTPLWTIQSAESVAMP